MIAAAEQSAILIPGAAETFAALMAKGVRIGSGTGYTREMMTAIVPAAAAQGYAPEVVVCSDDVPEGRPAPFMTWRALTELRAFPPGLCVKVDDAPVGILEGRNAGCWTIGVAASGNGVGLSAAALEALPGPERARRVSAAARLLKAAGADLVVETARDLEAALDVLAGWIAEGRVPAAPSARESVP
jgi:phosphonoacetaldehyde hydrolase